jgi:hypothetical protein
LASSALSRLRNCILRSLVSLTLPTRTTCGACPSCCRVV